MSGVTLRAEAQTLSYNADNGRVLAPISLLEAVSPEILAGEFVHEITRRMSIASAPAAREPSTKGTATFAAPETELRRQIVPPTVLLHSFQAPELVRHLACVAFALARAGQSPA